MCPLYCMYILVIDRHWFCLERGSTSPVALSWRRPEQGTIYDNPNANEYIINLDLVGPHNKRCHTFSHPNLYHTHSTLLLTHLSALSCSLYLFHVTCVNAATLSHFCTLFTLFLHFFHTFAHFCTLLHEFRHFFTLSHTAAHCLHTFCAYTLYNIAKPMRLARKLKNNGHGYNLLRSPRQLTKTYALRLKKKWQGTQDDNR